MAVYKDFKNCKTNRPELDNLQNTNLLDSSFKMIYYLKRYKCYFDCDATIIKSQIQFRKVEENLKLSTC